MFFCYQESSDFLIGFFYWNFLKKIKTVFFSFNIQFITNDKLLDWLIDRNNQLHYNFLPVKKNISVTSQWIMTHC